MWLSPEETQALWLSARVALCSTALCLPLAVALAWWLERRSFHGKFLIDALVQLPMVLPPVVPGYLLLLLLGTHPKPDPNGRSRHGYNESRSG